MSYLIKLHVWNNRSEAISSSPDRYKPIAIPAGLVVAIESRPASKHSLIRTDVHLYAPVDHATCLMCTETLEEIEKQLETP